MLRWKRGVHATGPRDAGGGQYTCAEALVARGGAKATFRPSYRLALDFRLPVSH